MVWKGEAKVGGVMGIRIPAGVYVPKTDNLKGEIIAAAKQAKLENFNVKIDGTYYDNPEDLHTNSIAELAGKEIVVEPYDIAG